VERAGIAGFRPRAIQSINRKQDVNLGIPNLQLRVAQLHAVRSPLNRLPNGSTIASIVKRKAQKGKNKMPMLVVTQVKGGKEIALRAARTVHEGVI